MQETEAFWTEWCSRCTYEGEHRDLVMRSLITLKALTYAPTGGIVAAPTTSLPEKLGGARNWDYRFCWLRDATFTLLALMNSGYTEEASAWHNWLLRAVAGSPANMQIMYGIMGQRRLLEWEAGWLPGYEGAQPVRVGNAAHAQLQLDVYGELIDAFHQSRVAKLEARRGTAGRWNARCWSISPRSGTSPITASGSAAATAKHYVLSKVMTWVAFDRGIKSAEKFGFKAPLEKWRALARRHPSRRLRKGLRSRAELRSSNPTARNCSMPASCCCRRSASCRRTDPRMRGTLAAIEQHLMRDGFVLRHDPREVATKRSRSRARSSPARSGLPTPMCWRASSTRRRRCSTAWSRSPTISACWPRNTIPARSRQTGNFPQALTHIALINTAHNLSAAKQATEKPAMQRSK